MTDFEKRLSEIKARAEAATPGPWRIEDNFQLENGCLCLCCHEYAGKNVTTDGPDLHEQDATFIAHARADIDWLVAEVERLQLYEHVHKENAEAASYATQTAIEQTAYIARLEARLRTALRSEFTALRSEFWEDASIDDVNTPRCQEYIDSEMAKLKEGK